jgi:PPM family protein phosphatase
MMLVAAGVTHRGAVRRANQDCIAIDSWTAQRDMASPLAIETLLDGPFLCVIADGLGGHSQGELASALAVRRLVDEAHRITDAAQLHAALEALNQSIYAAMAEDESRIGMGTTIAGLIVLADLALVFNVGDSRIYRRIDDQTLDLVSSDDTMSAEYVSPRERTGQFGHHLLQSLGGAASFQPIAPHILALPLDGAPQRFVLCSDGLTDMLDQSEIEDCLDASSPRATAARLFEAAMAKGGDDNISVIVVDCGPNGTVCARAGGEERGKAPS